MIAALKTIVSFCFRYRWTAAILLLLLLDLTTWLAFRKVGLAPGFNHGDKLVHALAFFVLFGVAQISLRLDFFPRASARFALGLIVSNAVIWLAYGFFIEAVQGQLAYRSASLGDLLADGLGILAGVICAIFFERYSEESRTHGQA